MKLKKKFLSGVYGMLLSLNYFNTPTQGWGVLIQQQSSYKAGKGERREMFANQTGVSLTTCEAIGEMYGTHAPYATVIGKFICHDGESVTLELAGCGASDSHSFTHKHQYAEYITKMYRGKLVRLLGERSWDNRENMWGYRWTVHSVNLWDHEMVNAPDNIKRMCGTNC